MHAHVSFFEDHVHILRILEAGLRPCAVLHCTFSGAYTRVTSSGHLPTGGPQQDTSMIGLVSSRGIAPLGKSRSASAVLVTTAEQQGLVGSHHDVATAGDAHVRGIRRRQHSIQGNKDNSFLACLMTQYWSDSA